LEKLRLVKICPVCRPYPSRTSPRDVTCDSEAGGARESYRLTVVARPRSRSRLAVVRGSQPVHLVPVLRRRSVDSDFPRDRESRFNCAFREREVSGHRRRRARGRPSAVIGVGQFSGLSRFPGIKERSKFSLLGGDSRHGRALLRVYDNASGRCRFLSLFSLLFLASRISSNEIIDRLPSSGRGRAYHQTGGCDLLIDYA